jgi:hypothetical protein
MGTMTPASLVNRRQEILEIAASHGMRNVRVFGSVARGDARLDSDLDLLVDVDRVYLQHIRDALGDIHTYTSGGRAAFFADRMRQDATLRKLQVIGEAVKRLSEDSKGCDVGGAGGTTTAATDIGSVRGRRAVGSGPARDHRNPRATTPLMLVRKRATTLPAQPP